MVLKCPMIEVNRTHGSVYIIYTLSYYPPRFLCHFRQDIARWFVCTESERVSIYLGAALRPYSWFIKSSVGSERFALFQLFIFNFLFPPLCGVYPRAVYKLRGSIRSSSSHRGNGCNVSKKNDISSSWAEQSSSPREWTVGVRRRCVLQGKRTRQVTKSSRKAFWKEQIDVAENT